MDEQHHHPLERPHPTPKVYLKVAFALAVITALEVWVYYQQFLQTVLAPILLTLSATKFGLVVAFFMHLKFDHQLFRSLFAGGLLIAGSIALALLTLLGAWIHGHS